MNIDYQIVLVQDAWLDWTEVFDKTLFKFTSAVLIDV